MKSLARCETHLSPSQVPALMQMLDPASGAARGPTWTRTWLFDFKGSVGTTIPKCLSVSKDEKCVLCMPWAVQSIVLPSPSISSKQSNVSPLGIILDYGAERKGFSWSRCTAFTLVQDSLARKLVPVGWARDEERWGLQLQSDDLMVT